MKKKLEPTLNEADIELIQSIVVHAVNTSEKRIKGEIKKDINDSIIRSEERMRHQILYVELRLEKKIENSNNKLNKKIDDSYRDQAELLLDMIKTITDNAATQEDLDKINIWLTTVENKVLVA